MRVATFYDEDPRVEGTLVKVSGTSCVIELDNGVRVMRHKVRVTPIDHEAEEALRTVVG